MGADKHELSIALMRYRSGATHGVMAFVFIQLMLWGKNKVTNGLTWEWHHCQDSIRVA